MATSKLLKKKTQPYTIGYIIYNRLQPDNKILLFKRKKKNYKWLVLNNDSM